VGTGAHCARNAAHAKLSVWLSLRLRGKRRALISLPSLIDFVPVRNLDMSLAIC
jgi:hypothetical protein